MIISPVCSLAIFRRLKCKNSNFTRSDIADIYSTTADKISTVTCNGVQYFKGETNYTSQEDFEQNKQDILKNIKMK